MSFQSFTICPVCGCHTPMLKREHVGKIIKETTWCTQHGFIIWHCTKGIRKLIYVSKALPKQSISHTSFIERCQYYDSLKRQSSNGIRRELKK